MTLSEHKLATRKFLAQRSGVESLASSRGLTFGGAGASLALILLIAQIGVTKTAVQWSLGFAAAALPLWLALALTYDAWLALKLDFHDLYELRWLQLIQAWWFNFTGALTFLSIACLVYSLSTSIGHVFIGASLVGFVLIGAAILAAAYRIRHHMGRAQQGARKAMTHNISIDADRTAEEGGFCRKVWWSGHLYVGVKRPTNALRPAARRRDTPARPKERLRSLQIAIESGSNEIDNFRNFRVLLSLD